MTIEQNDSTFEQRKRGRPKLDLDLQSIKKKVLDSAYDVFLEKGFNATTTDLVAQRAKISKRSIYQAYASKDELFADVVLQKRHLILDPPGPDEGSPIFLDRLARLFRLDISEAESRERLALLDLITREAATSPQLTEYLYERRIIQTREVLIDWLLVERRDGRIRFDDVQLVASLLMNVVFGILQPRRRRGFGLALSEQAPHVLRSLEIVLAGLAIYSDRPQ